MNKVRLIREPHHEPPCHGGLWLITGRGRNKTAEFCGNVVCPDLDLYLAENPDVKVIDSLPEDCQILHNR